MALCSFYLPKVAFKIRNALNVIEVSKYLTEDVSIQYLKTNEYLLDIIQFYYNKYKIYYRHIQLIKHVEFNLAESDYLIKRFNLTIQYLEESIQKHDAEIIEINKKIFLLKTEIEQKCKDIIIGGNKKYIFKIIEYKK